MDSLGDRMKSYERDYEQRLMPQVPAIIRLDGKGFHNVTKNMDRPFDQDFCNLMHDITRNLIDYSNAIVGYHQSDEITLVLYNENPQGELFFAGKCNKLNSILASKASRVYNERAAHRFLTLNQEKFFKEGLFDCRCFSVPTKWEAINCLRWREQDATRNSIQMAARSMYSHQECENKNCSQLQDMMHEKGVNWNDYPSFFKRGAYFNKYGNLDLPPLNKITNPVEVIFNNEKPAIDGDNNDKSTVSA